MSNPLLFGFGRRMLTQFFEELNINISFFKYEKKYQQQHNLNVGYEYLTIHNTQNISRIVIVLKHTVSNSVDSFYCLIYRLLYEKKKKIILLLFLLSVQKFVTQRVSSFQITVIVLAFKMDFEYYVVKQVTNRYKLQISRDNKSECAKNNILKLQILIYFSPQTEFIKNSYKQQLVYPQIQQLKQISMSDTTNISQQPNDSPKYCAQIPGQLFSFIRQKKQVKQYIRIQENQDQINSQQNYQSTQNKKTNFVCQQSSENIPQLQFSSSKMEMGANMNIQNTNTQENVNKNTDVKIQQKLEESMITKLIMDQQLPKDITTHNFSTARNNSNKQQIQHPKMTDIDTGKTAPTYYTSSYQNNNTEYSYQKKHVNPSPPINTNVGRMLQQTAYFRQGATTQEGRTQVVLDRPTNLPNYNNINNIANTNIRKSPIKYTDNTIFTNTSGNSYTDINANNNLIKYSKYNIQAYVPKNISKNMFPKGSPLGNTYPNIPTERSKQKVNYNNTATIQPQQYYQLTNQPTYQHTPNRYFNSTQNVSFTFNQNQPTSQAPSSSTNNSYTNTPLPSQLQKTIIYQSPRHTNLSRPPRPPKKSQQKIFYTYPTCPTYPTYGIAFNIRPPSYQFLKLHPPTPTNTTTTTSPAASNLQIRYPVASPTTEFSSNSNSTTSAPSATTTLTPQLKEIISKKIALQVLNNMEGINCTEGKFDFVFGVVDRCLKEFRDF